MLDRIKSCESWPKSCLAIRSLRDVQRAVRSHICCSSLHQNLCNPHRRGKSIEAWAWAGCVLARTRACLGPVRCPPACCVGLCSRAGTYEPRSKNFQFFKSFFMARLLIGTRLYQRPNSRCFPNSLHLDSMFELYLTLRAF